MVEQEINVTYTINEKTYGIIMFDMIFIHMAFIVEKK